MNAPNASVHKPRAADRLRKAVTAQYPLIYLFTWEEDRVERMVASLAQSAQPVVPVAVWTATRGLVIGDSPVGDTVDAHAVLEHVIATPQAGFYLLKDFHRELAGNPRLARRLRDAYYALKERGKFLCIVAPVIEIPEELKKEIYLVEISLPAEDEIAPVMDYYTHRHFKGTITDQNLRQSLVNGLKGLTYGEMQHVLNGTFAGHNQFHPDMVTRILLEKEQITRKDGLIEFIFPRYRPADLGGYPQLKKWLSQRIQLFTKEAARAGITPPKGVLLMGISGCGKSLAVKVVSSLWNLPLFRLDMSNVYSGAYGTPENAFRRALTAADALAPCVLWIDEIESGIVGVKENVQGGGNTRIFSTFLTWMQEKDSAVFVAATANRIDLLPAEFIRKGRFDQVFFLDLPSEEERKQIFTIHLQKKGADMIAFDLLTLSKASDGWNGAEIEQLVEAAAIEAFNEKSRLAMDHLMRNLGKFVPLSKTMTEQIRQIRSWAYGRAINAS